MTPADLEASPACQLGQPAGVGGSAPATGQADVDIDHDLADPGRGGGVDRALAVDGDDHPHLVGGGGDRGGHRLEASRVEHLVGQQQVAAQPGGSHPQHLRGRGAGEALVAVAPLRGRDGRALVGLHVRTQPRAGEHLGHGGEVLLEPRLVEDERRCREVGDVHAS